MLYVDGLVAFNTEIKFINESHFYQKVKFFKFFSGANMQLLLNCRNKTICPKFYVLNDTSLHEEACLCYCPAWSPVVFDRRNWDFLSSLIVSYPQRRDRGGVALTSLLPSTSGSSNTCKSISKTTGSPFAINVLATSRLFHYKLCSCF